MSHTMHEFVNFIEDTRDLQSASDDERAKRLRGSRGGERLMKITNTTYSTTFRAGTHYLLQCTYIPVS